MATKKQKIFSLKEIDLVDLILSLGAGYETIHVPILFEKNNDFSLDKSKYYYIYINPYKEKKNSLRDFRCENEKHNAKIYIYFKGGRYRDTAKSINYDMPISEIRKIYIVTKNKKVSFSFWYMHGDDFKTNDLIDILTGGKAYLPILNSGIWISYVQNMILNIKIPQNIDIRKYCDIFKHISNKRISVKDDDGNIKIVSINFIPFRITSFIKANKKFAYLYKQLNNPREFTINYR